MVEATRKYRTKGYDKAYLDDLRARRAKFRELLELRTFDSVTMCPKCRGTNVKPYSFNDEHVRFCQREHYQETVTWKCYHCNAKWRSRTADDEA